MLPLRLWICTNYLVQQIKNLEGHTIGTPVEMVLVVEDSVKIVQKNYKNRSIFLQNVTKINIEKISSPKELRYQVFDSLNMCE